MKKCKEIHQKCLCCYIFEKYSTPFAFAKMSFIVFKGISNLTFEVAALVKIYHGIRKMVETCTITTPKFFDINMANSAIWPCHNSHEFAANKLYIIDHCAIESLWRQVV